VSDHRATGPEPAADEPTGQVQPVGQVAVESFAAGYEPAADAAVDVAEPVADAEPGASLPGPSVPGVPVPDLAVPGTAPEDEVASETALEDEAGGLPDLTGDAEFEGALESILLVVDSPISEEQLAGVLEQSVKRVTATLRRLAARYTEQSSGIDLRRIGDGWRFYTRDRFAPFVEKLLLDGQRAKLTRAALETLAVIAYRQPVTRARIAAVRGVNVDGVIRTLVARGLIAETGTDSDTGGILYRTTELFLERLGLSSLGDLPPIAPLLPEVDAIDDV
jgi:segregation and condensation protein B